MDLQLMLILWSVLGALAGVVGGKLLASRRRAGYLPYIAAGVFGGNIAGFITRAAFGQDGYNMGEIIAVVAAPIGAAIFIGLAHLIPVRQTVNH